jgi:mRNA interferase YafQ
MYEIVYSSKFKKDLKRIKKQGNNYFEKLFEIVLLLEKSGLASVPLKHKPHPLCGNYKNYIDIHVLPDLLLIAREDKNCKIIFLARAGSHSELF